MCIDTYMYPFIYMYAHLCLYMDSKYINTVYVCMYLCLFVCIYACMYGCMNRCLYVCIYTYICMSVQAGTCRYIQTCAYTHVYRNIVHTYIMCIFVYTVCVYA